MNAQQKPIKSIAYILILVVGGILLWIGFARTNTQHEPTTLEISRILIQVKPEGGGLARREFTADGWVNGGHASGDDPPRIYEEREQISPEETEAIWAAASALAEEMYPMDVPPQPQWNGYVELQIIFDDQSFMRLAWPFQEEYPDPKVQALVELLLKYDVGGW